MIRSEQERIRLESLQQLRQLGIDPYPAAAYPVDTRAAALAADFADDREVCLAGRILSRRIMGKASFAELQDSSGRMQIYLNRDELCPGEDKTLYNTVFKKLLDRGDVVGIKGTTFTTQTGEPSVLVKELTVLSKSIRPLPSVKTDEEGNVHDAFTDPELRYRMRYVDLLVLGQFQAGDQRPENCSELGVGAGGDAVGHLLRDRGGAVGEHVSVVRDTLIVGPEVHHSPGC